MPYYVRTLLLTASADDVAPHLEGHREHLVDLRRRGKLRLAGEYAGGEGFMDVLEAVDRLEAEGLARESPLIVEGLGAWMIREWSELDLG